MMISGLVCSAGGTLVAGITSAQGPIIGVGIPGWRISCTIAAILGFFTTIIMGLIQQMRFGQRLGRANEALGRLKALEFEASTGGKDLRELWQEYGDILRSYPEEVG